MTTSRADYKKRIDSLYSDYWHSKMTGQEFKAAINELLHQVEAETDRNSRIDELSRARVENQLRNAPDFIVYLDERVAVLAHREES